MSSIRLYILGALADHGPLHGHQLRLLAEQEHVTLWTDITVGGLYGALKRLDREQLIEELRHEQDGNYPTRQVWQITDTGRTTLRTLQSDGLREIVLRPDPFDLAMSRLDTDRLDALPAALEARLAALEARCAEAEVHRTQALPYLTAIEAFVMTHRAERLRAEVDWHTALLKNLPELVADELARKEHPAHD